MIIRIIMKNHKWSTWILQSFEVLNMSYNRPFWSIHWILSNVWAGLNWLSIVTEAFSAIAVSVQNAWVHDLPSDGSQLNNSAAIACGREEKAWRLSYSGPASWSSQLMQYSLKAETRCLHVSPCLFSVCKSSLTCD